MDLSDRDRAFRAKKADLELDFDSGILPFSYPQLRRSGFAVTNITWLELMMRSIAHLRESRGSTNWNAVDVRLCLNLIDEVAPYAAAATRAPQELVEAFFEGKLPIHFTDLNWLGLRLTSDQRANLRRLVVSAKLEDVHYD